MRRNKKWILVVIPFTALLISVSSHGQPFYKWTDEQGATHYTQTPPPQKLVKKVSINTHIPVDSAKEIKNLNDQSSQDLKIAVADKNTADQNKASAAAETERRNKNSKLCEQLKNNQATLQTGQRLRISNAKGEQTYASEDQKVNIIKQLSAQIQKDCL